MLPLSALGIDWAAVNTKTVAVGNSSWKPLRTDRGHARGQTAQDHVLDTSWPLEGRHCIVWRHWRLTFDEVGRCHIVGRWPVRDELVELVRRHGFLQLLLFRLKARRQVRIRADANVLVRQLLRGLARTKHALERIAPLCFLELARHVGECGGDGRRLVRSLSQVHVLAELGASGLKVHGESPTNGRRFSRHSAMVLALLS